MGVAEDPMAGLRELADLARRAADELAEPLAAACALVTDRVLAGGTVLACGNGGSAADAQHYVAELVGRMTCERDPIPAIALSSDPSVVTCIGNDYGYQELFARQVDAHGRDGDVLIAISTSGTSPNVLRALEQARARGLATVALVGGAGDPALELSDVVLHMPSTNTQRIQELHLPFLHALCEATEVAWAARSLEGVAS